MKCYHCDVSVEERHPHACAVTGIVFATGVEACGRPPSLTPELAEADVPTSLTVEAADLTPLAFSLEGLKGQCSCVVKRSQTNFQPIDFFATDDGAGRLTRVSGIFVGCDYLYPSLDCKVPTWMYMSFVSRVERAALEEKAILVGTPYETDASLAAAQRLRAANTVRRMKWPLVPKGIDITFNIEFLETCRWESVVWGRESHAGHTANGYMH